MICRICHRTRDEAMALGWGFIEDTLCEECHIMKRALKALFRSRQHLRLVGPAIRAEVERAVGIGQKVGHA